MWQQAVSRARRVYHYGVADKQRYGLEALRDVRRIDESTEQQAVAAQADAMRAAQQRADVAQARVDAQAHAAAQTQHAQQARLLQGAPAHLAVLAMHTAARQRQRLQVLAQEADRLAAMARGQDEQFDTAQQQLRQARAARALLDRHFAAWRARRAKQQGNREP